MSFRIIIGLVIGSLIALMQSCDVGTGSYHIKGTLTDFVEGSVIRFTEVTAKEMIKFDSAIVSATGKFEIKGDIPEPKILRMSSNEGGELFIITHPNEKITIAADAKALEDSYEIKGSQDSKLYRKYLYQLYHVKHQKLKILQAFEKIKVQDDFIYQKQVLEHQYAQIKDSLRTYTFEFLENNCESLSSLLILFQNISPKDPVMDHLKDAKYVFMVDSCLSQKYPELLLSRELNQHVLALKEELSHKTASEHYLIKHKEVPNIVMPDRKGEKVDLESLRGKWVLINFWASWNDESLNINDSLKNMYDGYKQNLELYNISLDKSKDAWVKNVRNKRYKGLHVNDLKFWDGEAVSTFNIHEIPANILLDPSGKLVEKNITIKALEQLMLSE